MTVEDINKFNEMIKERGCNIYTDGYAIYEVSEVTTGTAAGGVDYEKITINGDNYFNALDGDQPNIWTPFFILKDGEVIRKHDRFNHKNSRYIVRLDVALSRMQEFCWDNNGDIFNLMDHD